MDKVWEHFQNSYYEHSGLGFVLDLSGIHSETSLPEIYSSQIQKAFEAMANLEAGTYANPDEGRQVGHYWLRAPELAPSSEISQNIQSAVQQVQSFAQRLRSAELRSPSGKAFQHILVIGVGGSALGPQLLNEALADIDEISLSFMDNVDPDGIDELFASHADVLDQTLCVVISKSGGTKETCVGLLETETAFRKVGLSFEKHAVAVTQPKSKLEEKATVQGWLACFPIWEWVGGRTSLFSAVGVLPAALCGIDIESLLKGAALMDAATRLQVPSQNPAMLLALQWYHAAQQGVNELVILPYKDRLDSFGKYLQQLIMESLGKPYDTLESQSARGFVVYGNKGSSDQHAYVQQLRDGNASALVHFVQVAQTRHQASMEIESGVHAGDYLHGLMLGTQQALREQGRDSLCIRLSTLDALSMGALIALFERAVGFFASMVEINAYHQPGVEAGKRAAAGILKQQAAILEYLAVSPGESYSVEAIHEAIQSPLSIPTTFRLLEHLSANHRVHKTSKEATFDALYRHTSTS